MFPPHPIFTTSSHLRKATLPHIMNRPSRSSQSQAASIASAVAPIFHSAGSKRFAKARAQTPPSPSFSSTPVTTSVEATHAYPEEKFGVVGERFPVGFNHIYLDGKRLLLLRPIRELLLPVGGSCSSTTATDSKGLPFCHYSQ